MWHPAWARPARAFHSGGAKNQKAAAAATTRTNIAKDQRPAPRRPLAFILDRCIGGEFFFRPPPARAFCGEGGAATSSDGGARHSSAIAGASSIATSSGPAGPASAMSIHRIRRNRAPRRTPLPRQRPAAARQRSCLARPPLREFRQPAVRTGRAPAAAGRRNRPCLRFPAPRPKRSGSWCQLCLQDAHRTWRPPGGMAPSFTTYFVSQAGQVRIIRVGASRKRLTDLSSNGHALARRPAPCHTRKGSKPFGGRERRLTGTIVEFDRVGLRYGTGAEVLRDLDFRLNEGGFYFLTGPSGAGKTSLLKLLYLAQRPTRGRMSLFGDELEPCLARRPSCIPPQDRRGVPGLPAGPAPVGIRQCRAAAPHFGQVGRRNRRPGPRNAGLGRARRSGQCPAADPVGRGAAAGGHRSCGDRSSGPHHRRRADRQCRCGHGGADPALADRDEPAWDDGHRRDPRCRSDRSDAGCAAHPAGKGRAGRSDRCAEASARQCPDGKGCHEPAVRNRRGEAADSRQAGCAAQSRC